jgi:hypothetical protein
LFAFEAVVEEFIGVREAGTQIKNQFYLVFEGVGNTDDAVVGPDSSAPPFHFLHNVRVGFTDNPPDIGNRIAPPIT